MQILRHIAWIMTPVDQYIFAQPEKIRETLDFLNAEILSFDQEINCCIKWKVPYYSRSKSIGYLNVLKGEKVELNFTQAFQFNEQVKSLIDFRNRSIVGGIIYGSLIDIDVHRLHKVLNEALTLDGK